MVDNMFNEQAMIQIENVLSGKKGIDWLPLAIEYGEQTEKPGGLVIGQYPNYPTLKKDPNSIG